MNAKMKVELFHTDTCHIWQTALKELDATLKENGIDADIRTITVKTQEEAETHRFLGSPTLHINGKDVDPMAKKATQYGLSACRTYWWNGKSYEYPPKDMILEAILKG